MEVLASEIFLKNISKGKKEFILSKLDEFKTENIILMLDYCNHYYKVRRSKQLN